MRVDLEYTGMLVLVVQTSEMQAVLSPPLLYCLAPEVHEL